MDAGCDNIETAVQFMAPEVLHHHGKYAQGGATPAIDVWAAGCFLFTLLSGVLLFGVAKSDAAEEVSDDQAMTASLASALEHRQTAELVVQQQAEWVSRPCV